MDYITWLYMACLAELGMYGTNVGATAWLTILYLVYISSSPSYNQEMLMLELFHSDVHILFTLVLFTEK